MKLSIVTICYQDLAGLQRTVDSLRRQIRFDFEQIIVDGGSKDGTAEYLSQLKVPWSLKFISERDQGLYDAMNKGAALAQGDFIWFLNSGDLCADPQTLHQILGSLHSEVDVLYGKVWVDSLYGRRSVGAEVTFRDFETRMPVCHQAVIYRRDLILQHPYPLEFRIVADWISTKKIWQSGARTQFLDEFFAVFDAGGVSSQNQWKLLREKFRAEESWLTKIKILFREGGKALALWSLKKIHLYDFFKKRQHQKSV